MHSDPSPIGETDVAPRATHQHRPHPRRAMHRVAQRFPGPVLCRRSAQWPGIHQAPTTSRSFWIRLRPNLG
jgi:hypothetical protein